MNRRRFLAGLATTPLVAPHLSAPVAAQFLPGPEDLATTAADVWQAWRTGYLLPDGRVVDRLQRNSSHSEGQGYGMLLASEFNDREAFARMFAWTEANLAVRPDPLLAWRWLPDSTAPVPDTNNASDGDLFYAWALVRAARRFAERRYLDRAAETAAALARHCLIASPAEAGVVLMLPGAFGFASPGRVVMNPSYLMPLALREVAAATGVTELALAAQHGEGLLATIAAEGLVPDWVQITRAGTAPAEGFSANAGYEAIRVPLFLIWSGQPRHPAVTNMMRLYDTAVRPGQPVPTVVEPVSGLVLEASPDPGYQALAGLVSCAARAGQVGARIPPFDPSQPYYPATLQLFAMIAANTTSPECVPV
jgi:endoglucanase